MKYSVIIISSDNLIDYYEDSADSIRYDNLEKSEVDNLIRLSLIEDYSVVVQKYKEKE